MKSCSGKERAGAQIIRRLVLLSGALALSAFTSTKQFADIGFKSPADSYGLIVLRRDVSVGLLTAGGLVELRGARVIASDKTTTRIDGVTHWQWVFLSDSAVLHEIAPRRARSVAEAVLGDHRPEVCQSACKRDPF